ncbi:MAG: hypothetical protein M1818_006660 [Claussenomyces sp. TS43310]|nr:MAG: hypothetical protein M1818_006907 [Claussenomyces sp. TS43310]KAI9735082.1 MAG: hypothetical protein M1818_006660 [Claussenomyces sp. TS43310]
MVGLAVLKFGKRGAPPYSLPLHRNDATRHRDWHTLEKHGQQDRDSSDDDSDASSTSSRQTTASSRNTSASYQSRAPMLHHKTSGSSLGGGVRYRIPRRMVQKLCFFMIAVIIGFILFLVRMSYVSQRHLSDHRPEPKPQWESFPFLTRYYGGIRTLVSTSENTPEYPSMGDEMLQSNATAHEEEISTRELPASKIFNPYPKYKSEAYLSEHAPVQECFLDAKRSIRIPPLQYYEGRPQGFPKHIMGSYDLLDLPEDVCFERYGRLGPYGHGYGLRLGGTGTGQFGDKEGSEAVWSEIHEVDYRKVDWAAAQKRCFEDNSARFQVDEHEHNAVASGKPAAALTRRDEERGAQSSKSANPTKPRKQHLSRTAVVVRLWDDYEYHEDGIMMLRALISELSLGSGGEYDIHLLVQVHNQSVAVWADKTIYDEHLRRSVPEEFRGIATLWSESQSILLYPGLEETWARGPNLPVHGVYRGSNMALQNFAMGHPEYDYFWNWEMDARYTGHYYDLLSKFEKWSKAQPRKLLWERNGRFYVPSVHGSWEDFTHMVRVQTESGVDSVNDLWAGIDSTHGSLTKGVAGDKSIWGPERPGNPSDWLEIDGDPVAPHPFSKDDYVWGVGEEADLITLNPIFDPEGTTWGLANDVTGYNTTAEDSTEPRRPPRRAVITNISRLSKKLLTTMHRETAFGKHHAFTEMWPATAALHHGYKAVYVPHPMYIDRVWPVGYLAATMNAGKNGASGGARNSPFGVSEHNFKGTTWYYNAGFAGNLWKRWLGLRVDNEGGEQFETERRERDEAATGVLAMKGGQGRMCVPPMLLHPVKEVEIPVEAMALGVEEAEFGPSD